jgi:hypothetical protein
MTFLHPAHTVPPAKPGGIEHTIRPNRWWHPRDRLQARRTAFILSTLRHPAAREALQESGTRAERRHSRVTRGQLG